MAITINRGLVSVNVCDADGTRLGTVKFSTNDPALQGRWEMAMTSIQTACSEADKNDAKALVQLDELIQQQLDFALNTKASEVFFAGCSSVCIGDDGRFVFEAVLDEITPLIVAGQKRMAEISKAKVEKYSAMYPADSAAGLAPGQQA